MEPQVTILLCEYNDLIEKTKENELTDEDISAVIHVLRTTQYNEPDEINKKLHRLHLNGIDVRITDSPTHSRIPLIIIRKSMQKQTAP